MINWRTLWKTPCALGMLAAVALWGHGEIVRAQTVKPGISPIPKLTNDASSLAKAASEPVTVSIGMLNAEQQPISKGSLFLGEEATLELEVRSRNEARVFVPTNPALGAFHLLTSPSPPQERLDGGVRVQLYRMSVMALRVGAKAVPPIEVTYQMPDGTSGTVRTQRLRVRVKGRLVNEQDPRLGPPPAPVSVVTTNWTLVWILVIFGSALTAVVLTMLSLFFLRAYLDALRPPAPARPANEVALERLADIEADELEPVERYTQVADTLREYLGGRYGFDGLEHTSHELILELRGADLRTITEQEVVGILQDTDLVKFARVVPGEEAAWDLIPAVRRIVDLTWVDEVDDGAEEQLVRLEPAPAYTRLKAGFLDVTLAGVFGLVAMGALAIAGLFVWAWLGVVLTGLLLFFRDVMGPGSPGKVIMGLRVVRCADEQTSARSGKRLLRNVLLLLPPVGLPVEFLVLIHHPLRYRVGDIWAGTEVVVWSKASPAPGGTS